MKTIMWILLIMVLCFAGYYAFYAGLAVLKIILGLGFLIYSYIMIKIGMWLNSPR